MSKPRYAKRHYEDAARIIREAKEEFKTPEELRVVNYIRNEFSFMFTEDNKLFKVGKFLEACEPKPEK